MTLLLAGLLHLLPQSAVAEEQRTLTIASYNIRFDGIGEERWAWESRAGLVVDTIDAADADIIGLQEVTSWQGMDLVSARQIETLRTRLPGYSLAGAEPVDRLWSSNPILFRHDRLRLLETGVLVLAGANRQPRKSAEARARALRLPEGWWGDMTGRFARWARFEDAVTGTRFVVANAHYSPVRGINRYASSGTLIRHVPAIAAGEPVVVTGDLNTTPFSSSVTRLRRGLELVDPVADRSQGTYNRGKPEPRRGRIDYVLTPQTWKVRSARIFAPRPGGRFPSDHDMVIVEVHVP